MIGKFLAWLLRGPRPVYECTRCGRKQGFPDWCDDCGSGELVVVPRRQR